MTDLVPGPVVVGPSGSGKTTLLILIGCIDRPSDGTTAISEKPRYARNPRRGGVAARRDAA
jgi:ABC-type lipoprotein export system ATPase subunit